MTHDELRRLAEAATSGPWCRDNYECKPGDLGPERYGIFELGEDDPALAYVGPWGEAEANAAYIAAANPARVLALLDEVEALKEAAAQVLDDMGKEGKCCCGAAKADLRLALGEWPDLDFTLADAQAIADACDPRKGPAHD